MTSEKQYLSEIKKRLKYPASKRKEILNEIQLNISKDIKDGNSIINIINEMGTPEEVAKEFNDNISINDIKRKKTEKLMKIIAIILISLSLLGGLAYWILPKTTELSASEIFNEEEVLKVSEDVIKYIDNNEFSDVESIMSEKLKKAVSSEVIIKAKESISEDFGLQKSFNPTFAGEVSQLGEKFALVEINVKYENASVIYRLSFDEQMNLTGLYMR